MKTVELFWINYLMLLSVSFRTFRLLKKRKKWALNSWLSRMLASKILNDIWKKKWIPLWLPTLFNAWEPFWTLLFSSEILHYIKFDFFSWSTFFCSILSSLKKNLLFFNLSLSIEYILCYIRTRVHIIIIIIIIPFSLVWQDNIEKEIHCIFSYWLNSLYLMKTFYSHQEILFLQIPMQHVVFFFSASYCCFQNSGTWLDH